MNNKIMAKLLYSYGYMHVHMHLCTYVHVSLLFESVSGWTTAELQFFQFIDWS